MPSAARFRPSALPLAFLAAGLLASAAIASPPVPTAQPAPNWLTGGTAPVPDPLQTFLDGKMSAFLEPGGGYDVATAYLKEHSGEASFNDGDCVTSLQAYHAAADRQKQLQQAFDSMQTAFQALNQNQRAAVGLAASRSALLAAQITAFGGAYTLFKGAAAIVPGTVIGAINYLATEIGIIGSAYYDNSAPDVTDQKLNSMGLALSTLVAFQESGHKVGEPYGSAIANIGNAVKATLDLFDDYNKYKQTEGAATAAYLQAGAHYSTLLNEFQKSVTNMNLTDCPPKEKRKPAPGLGTPPPDCGAVGKDYADPTCTTQSRNGTFHFGSHSVKPGGTLTGTVSNRCERHSTADFSKPPDQPCPIDWSQMVSIGTRVSGCVPAAASCTVRLSKTSAPTSYLIVTIGITNDQGTGIAKDYYYVSK
jgi:hypothetical protein